MFKKFDKKKRGALANILIFQFILFGIIFATNNLSISPFKGEKWTGGLSVNFLTINGHIILLAHSKRAFNFSRTKPNPAGGGGGKPRVSLRRPGCLIGSQSRFLYLVAWKWRRIPTSQIREPDTGVKNPNFDNEDADP